MGKMLVRKIESCVSCPYLAIIGDTTQTIMACKNRKAAPGGSGLNARVILKQPMSWVVADVVIADWCPLPEQNNDLRSVIKMILCNEFAGIGEELVDNIEIDVLKAVSMAGAP